MGKSIPLKNKLVRPLLQYFSESENSPMAERVSESKHAYYYRCDDMGENLIEINQK